MKIFKELEIYRFYKGENQNPYDHGRQNAASNFWFYEHLFEEKFNKGNFTTETWIPPNSADLKEWETVLSEDPINKQELFKLWLFYLLTDRLPDKYESNSEHFIRLYFDTSQEIQNK